jgi:capping protein beta
MEQALDLMRRLPPAKVTENLTSLVELAPHLTEELLARVDQPLQARP